MKYFGLIAVATAVLGVTGCVSNPSYDSLGYHRPGYYSSPPSYSVGVTYGTYPVYRPAPVYRAVPVYPPGYFAPPPHHHHYRGPGFSYRHGR